MQICADDDENERARDYKDEYEEDEDGGVNTSFVEGVSHLSEEDRISWLIVVAMMSPQMRRPRKRTARAMRHPHSSAVSVMKRPPYPLFSIPVPARVFICAGL